MNQEDWQKLNEIYFAALELGTNERQQFISASCGDDAMLRREIEDLLAATQIAREKDFLVQGALAINNPPISATKNFNQAAEKRIGNYRIIGELGQGGMGTVFKAVRINDFTQQVAIKIIKGEINSVELVRRFEVERQILALLNYPNIARLLDGGATTDGSPFLVMEYVEGVPIDEFCRTNNLSLAARLELFQTVASAVAYAHKNLVIHRDLKPSNILVTADGTPKLLDFGIAKLLDEPTASNNQTATLMRMFTPDYASPEQARGEKLTTATDVYSLGVVFYELLTDARLFSFAGKSFEEILRSISETDPERPSRAVTKNNPRHTTSREQVAANPKPKIQNLKSLEGDLDNIALKALRKEPEERYSSIEDFATDVRRHLANLPIMARSQTFGYRAAKYFKRHQTTVFAAALVLFSLVGGLSIAVWQAVVARRAQARAEARFNEVRKLANTILFDYHDGIASLPGATRMREKMVTDSLEYLNNLSSESDNNPDLQREIVKAYRKVGDIQGNADTGNTGKTKEALASYQKALEIQTTLAAVNLSNADDQRMLANVSLDVGDQLLSVGDSAGADEYYQKALGIFSRAAENSPNDIRARSDLARGLWKMASFQTAQQDYDAALENYGQAAKIYQKLAADDPTNRKHERNVALTFKQMGAIKQKRNDYAAALKLFEQALAIDVQNAAAQPNDVSAQLDLSFTVASVASAMRDTGNFQRALENYQRALTIRQKIYDADPKNSLAEETVARALREIGKTFLKLENFAEARRNLQQALVIDQKLAEADSINLDKKKRVTETLDLLKSVEK